MAHECRVAPGRGVLVELVHRLRDQRLPDVLAPLHLHRVLKQSLAIVDRLQVGEELGGLELVRAERGEEDLARLVPQPLVLVAYRLVLRGDFVEPLASDGPRSDEGRDGWHLDAHPRQLGAQLLEQLVVRGVLLRLVAPLVVQVLRSGAGGRVKGGPG